MRETEPELLELSTILALFRKESDRGLALTAAAYLDERLTEILRAYLVEGSAAGELLSGFNAPLGTLSARSAAALALGLIEQVEFDEISIVRKIRNEFAHSWAEASFARGRARDLAQRLPWRGPAEFENGADPRDRFNTAVALLLVDLLWRARLVARERRVPRAWPSKARQ